MPILEIIGEARTPRAHTNTTLRLCWRWVIFAAELKGVVRFYVLGLYNE